MVILLSRQAGEATLVPTHYTRRVDPKGYNSWRIPASLKSLRCMAHTPTTREQQYASDQVQRTIGEHHRCGRSAASKVRRRIIRSLNASIAHVVGNASATVRIQRGSRSIGHQQPPTAAMVTMTMEPTGSTASRLGATAATTRPKLCRRRRFRRSATAAPTAAGRERRRRRANPPPARRSFGPRRRRNATAVCRRGRPAPRPAWRVRVSTSPSHVRQAGRGTRRATCRAGEGDAESRDVLIECVDR